MNKITVPVFELQNDGSIKPNYLFHRPLDKMHSRCIEYPYAVSKWRRSDRRILDVGTVQASPLWIKWLKSLPSEVHAIDYDEPDSSQFTNINFLRVDVMNLPYDDNLFDCIFAVSVIEHIGLKNPQVVGELKPRVEQWGDIAAVKELARVLRPGGRLVMTFPFGLKERLILGNEARCYNRERIRKFESILQVGELSYYEYQSLYLSSCLHDWKSRFFRKAQDILSALAHVDMPGLAAWKRIPMEQTRAKNEWHVDGAICGVWRKV
jgi:SAM-dependent methyltransferase